MLIATRSRLRSFSPEHFLRVVLTNRSEMASMFLATNQTTNGIPASAIPGTGQPTFVWEDGVVMHLR